ncbi:MAG: hypothetical protein JSR58_02675 [Verrucomicrobia bacterium]|nr:hypothetical protein [Verrucomicrobiota bacterium]
MSFAVDFAKEVARPLAAVVVTCVVLEPVTTVVRHVWEHKVLGLPKERDETNQKQVDEKYQKIMKGEDTGWQSALTKAGVLFNEGRHMATSNPTIALLVGVSILSRK